MLFQVVQPLRPVRAVGLQPLIDLRQRLCSEAVQAQLALWGGPRRAGPRAVGYMSNAVTLTTVTWWQWLLVSAAVVLATYVALIAWLLLTGRRQDARALAGLVPDCLVLIRRLLADERVPRRRKLVLVGVLAYLAMPFDLVPDFIPVAGQLDDVVLVALALRSVLRSGGPSLLREHWPGPPPSLNALLRLTYGRSA